MKKILISALFFVLPLAAHAEGQASFHLKVTAVACVLSPTDVEDCQIISNPTDEDIVLPLERKTVGDWSVDSKEFRQVYEMRAPQLSAPLRMEVAFSVIRDAGSKPATAEVFDLGGSIAPANGADQYPAYATVTFSDQRSFQRFHAAGNRVQFPLENGKVLELSPQFDVTKLLLTK